MAVHGIPDTDNRSHTFDPVLTSTEKERLLQLIHGMYRIGRLGSLFPSYRDELNNVAKQRLSELVSSIVDTSPDAMVILLLTHSFSSMTPTIRYDMTLC
jgi:hypothetical protein